ncbi:hypothetical protein EVAR_34126_1 [Eumeta japonica]|uniref:Uncharacterized protein n=1 Tax=Eumeta variegata TaxID=151549 RepID=A0A4C1WKG3_EUMVA|nr:hypothetical protein EVAR_34126_1 [Eumeta japonica]
MAPTYDVTCGRRVSNVRPSARSYLCSRTRELHMQVASDASPTAGVGDRCLSDSGRIFVPKSNAPVGGELETGLLETGRGTRIRIKSVTGWTSGIASRLELKAATSFGLMAQSFYIHDEAYPELSVVLLSLPACPGSKGRNNKSLIPIINNSIDGTRLITSIDHDKCHRTACTSARAVGPTPRDCGSAMEDERASKESPYALNYVKIWKVFSQTMMSWPKEKRGGSESRAVVAFRAIQPVLYTTFVAADGFYIYEHHSETDFTTKGHLYITFISGMVTIFFLNATNTSSHCRTPIVNLTNAPISKEIDAPQAERLGRSCLSIIPRSRSRARLRRNATMSHAFSCVQPAFIDL